MSAASPMSPIDGVISVGVRQRAKARDGVGADVTDCFHHGPTSSALTT